MREWIDVRVGSDELIRLLPSDLGHHLDSKEDLEFRRSLDPDYVSGRRIYLARDNPRWEQIRAVLDKDPHGYHAWITRRYARQELEQAQILRLVITKEFEPEGEACGTVYDETAACPVCGAGRRQVSDLHLQLRRVFQQPPSIPQAKRTGIARTIANEIIVSQALAELIKENRGVGAELRPVRGCGADAKITPHWKQLWVTGKAGRTVPPTEFGLKPFNPDDRGEYRCPRGHVSGLNLLSEVYVRRENWDGSDIAATEDLVGSRMGVLVPSPMLLISQRFYRLLLEHNLKGFKAEVAHLV